MVTFDLVKKHPIHVTIAASPVALISYIKLIFENQTIGSMLITLSTVYITIRTYFHSAQSALYKLLMQNKRLVSVNRQQQFQILITLNYKFVTYRRAHLQMLIILEEYNRFIFAYTAFYGVASNILLHMSLVESCFKPTTNRFSAAVSLLVIIVYTTLASICCNSLCDLVNHLIIPKQLLYSYDCFLSDKQLHRSSTFSLRLARFIEFVHIKRPFKFQFGSFASFTKLSFLQVSIS